MQLQLHALTDFPMVEVGDDLLTLILSGIRQNGLNLSDGDILVLAQKIVSKAENRYVVLESITPSAQANTLAAEVDKDPRFVELVLRESRAVIRKAPGVLIVEHHLGFIHANAGIDQSNIDHSAAERVLLLPENPDASAERLHSGIKKTLGIHVPVIINDSMGRAWRNGTLGLAIGLAGMPAIDNKIGHVDLFGRELKATAAAIADELAAAASLVMGQTTEKTPVVLVKGYPLPDSSSPSGVQALLRDKKTDLFR
ncbi:MAG TPA: coenzyme F420-0:L-glutamate ligase [Pseudomonadales bacterium]|nr:coenzyme F420-0:L-glutamate ligase [Pseudomonadales bacterium]